MPCNCDYMEPNAAEKNTKQTAQNLIYVYKSLGKDIPSAYKDAAETYYPNIHLLNEIVIDLCSTIRQMTDEQRDKIIYDGRNSDARKLADWWEKHQKADEARIKKEKLKERQKKQKEDKEYKEYLRLKEKYETTN